ncbi:MAG TPA: MerR family transcriptional regulator [Acidimicrobiales bacterium]
MSRAANGRAHLSIGEVLSLLQDEFPDVTISKIRFLESQGLLDPERTPSGYRKFYDEDIERLRWILRQQKDHYLPLKVIKDRLDAEDGVPTSSIEASESQGRLPLARGSVAVSERVDTRKVVASPPARSSAPPTPAPASGARTPAAPVRQPSPARETPRQAQPAARPVRQPESAQQRPAARTTPPPVPAAAPVPATQAVSLTVEELADASGLAVRDVRDLERFGLIEARDSGDDSSYDGDALIVAQTAAGFLQHGIEARHMRTYKVAIDREAGLFEQIVSPVLKQRNPEARTRAARTVTELIRLGEVMRGVLLRRELRDLQGGA